MLFKAGNNFSTKKDKEIKMTNEKKRDLMSDIIRYISISPLNCRDVTDIYNRFRNHKEMDVGDALDELVKMKRIELSHTSYHIKS
jgi:hypothetical protein